MGVNGIAAYLNEHGYKKKKRQNNTLDAFATSFIKGVLDNPIYCGKWHLEEGKLKECQAREMNSVL